MSDVRSSGPTPPAGRIAALDGLRGFAAVVVVLHHVVLTAPDAGSFVAMVRHTPLQLLASGEEAVLVFFVLSGLALVLPSQRPDFDWFAYYPSRLVRLLLPVAAAIVLALIIIAVTPQTAAHGLSGWSKLSMQRFDPTALSGIEVLFGNILVDNPLWSLRYEVLFSLLLPVYVLATRVVRRRWMIVLPSIAIVMMFGELSGDPVLVFLPVFLLGAGMTAFPSVLSGDAGRRGAGWWILGLAVALLAFEARWILADLGKGSAATVQLAQIIAAFGAAGLVVVAVGFGPVRRIFETRVARLLGRVSFSLYLVHVPILLGSVAVVARVLPGAPWFTGAAIAVVPIVAVTWAFARFVERPAHRLSQRIARRLRDQRQKVVAGAPDPS